MPISMQILILGLKLVGELKSFESICFKKNSELSQKKIFGFEKFCITFRAGLN